jgi:proline iminopeptidase
LRFVTITHINPVDVGGSHRVTSKVFKNAQPTDLVIDITIGQIQDYGRLFQGGKLITVNRILIILLCTAVTLVLSSFIFLYILSPGEAVPVLTGDGSPIENSIYKIEKWKVGGVEQKMIIYGQNVDNPVILFLHGGPGLCEFPLINETNKELEKYATIIYWGQRGSSLSPVPTTSESLSLERFVEDTIEISERARKRFGKRKIFLLTHSWGSLFGMIAAARRPDLFNAYIGISQISNWAESDQRAYGWSVDKARRDENKKAIEELEAISPYTSKDLQKKGVLLRYVNDFGAGMLHDMDQMYNLLLKPLITVNEYSMGEKLSYFPTLIASTEAMMPEIGVVNLFKKIPKIEIPVYLIHGKHDQQVSYSLTREYFDHLKAPRKEFFTFENSAHGLIPEEPEKYKKIMIKILLENP